jgi:hypothetical protein
MSLFHLGYKTCLMVGVKFIRITMNANGRLRVGSSDVRMLKGILCYTIAKGDRYDIRRFWRRGSLREFLQPRILKQH